jgi:hypothetical protein
VLVTPLDRTLIAVLGTATLVVSGCKDNPTSPPGPPPGQAPAASAAPAAAAAAGGSGFTRDFRLESCDFRTVGNNPFFPLVPGRALILEGKADGDHTRFRLKVLHQTERVGGVETRVVEERTYVNGELDEISRNFFAHCVQTNSVFYFGEDVNFYQDGTVISHEGSWRHKVNGARAGLIMPGLALLGSKYAQEIAPGVALGRAEILSLDAAVRTPLRGFQGAVVTRETNGLDPAEVGEKIYAPGIGLVVDDELRLVSLQGF